MKAISSKTLCLLLALLLFGGLGLFGGATTASAAEKIKIALVIPSTIDDMAWSQAMYEGLKRIEDKEGKDKVEISVSERLGNPVDAAAAIRQYATQGYNIIIAHGTQYQSLLNDIAPDFPNTTFAYGTGFSAAHPNIFAYDPHAQEGSFLMGVVAGLTSKSGIIGLVGPVEAGDAIKFNRGFEQGVLAVNPKAQVRIAYTGSFNDLVGAGEIARAHIKAGADVLSGSSQQAVGAIKAASETPGVLFMGSDLNPKAIAPKTVLAAQVYDFEKVVRDMIDSRAKGVLGGSAIPLSLANGYEYLEFNLPISDEVKAKVDEYTKQIVDGSLKLDIRK